MSEIETAAVQPTGIQPTGERSALVSAAGVVLLLLPWSMLAAGFALAMPDSSLWTEIRRAYPAPMNAVALAIPLAVTALSTVAGVAVLRRWLRCRTIVLFPVGLYAISLLSLPPQFLWAIEAFNLGLTVSTLVLGTIGIFILVANPEEPPAAHLSRVPPVEVFLVLVGIFFLAGLQIEDEVPNEVAVGIVGVLLVAAGLAAARSWRSWRLYAGLIAWCVIVLSVLFVANPLITLLEDPTSWLRMLDRAEPSLLLVALGCSILWAKRHEPRQV